MKKKLSKLLRWETMLVVLLIVLWVVFEARDNSLDAALLAKGRKAKDVFNFTKMLNGMGVYMLYSFMALGMALILGMGDIDISVGASATLSASVMGISYRALINGGTANGTAFAIAILACLLTGCLCRECICTDRGTDPFHLIGCDGHADARTADQDTLFIFTGGNRVRHRLCIVRVITGIRCEGSEVFIGNPSVIQMLHQHLFVLVTAMVTSYRYHSTPPKC